MHHFSCWRHTLLSHMGCSQLCMQLCCSILPGAHHFIRLCRWQMTAWPLVRPMRCCLNRPHLIGDDVTVSVLQTGLYFSSRQRGHHKCIKCTTMQLQAALEGTERRGMLQGVQRNACQLTFSLSLPCRSMHCSTARSRGLTSEHLQGPMNPAKLDRNRKVWTTPDHDSESYPPAYPLLA